MNTESHTSLNKQEIDKIERDLKALGYKKVFSQSELQPFTFFRNEWTGTPKSFDGPKNYHTIWCKF